MGQVVAYKRLKTMKNSKTVTHKSGGNGLQFKRWLFMGGFQQYCKALMTLVLWIGYGRCSFLNLLYQSVLKAVMTGT